MYVINTKKIILEYIEYVCPNSEYVLNLSSILSPWLSICILDFYSFAIFPGLGYIPRIIAVLTKTGIQSFGVKMLVKMFAIFIIIELH